MMDLPADMNMMYTPSLRISETCINIGLMGSFLLGSAVRTLKFEDMSIENVETDKY